MSELSFTPDIDQETPLGLSFTPDLIEPTIVPRNAEEVAHQVAMADPEYPALKALDDMRLGGTQPIYERIWDKRMQEQIAATRLAAEKSAIAFDADGVTSHLTRLQELISKHQAGLPKKGEAAQATAEAAVNAAAKSAQQKYPSLGVFGPASSQEAKKLAARNVLLENIDRQLATLSDETKWYHVLGYLGLAILPGQSAITAGMYAKEYGQYTGESHVIDERAAVRDFVQFLAGLDPDEQRTILEGIAANSSNPMLATEYLNKLREYSNSQATTDDIFKVIDIADLTLLAAGAKSLVTAGKTAHVIKGTAGGEEAAKIVAMDILKKINTSGLSDSEKMAAALSSGYNPYELLLEGKSLDGLSATIQQKLKEGTEALGRELKNRLESSGQTTDEIKKGLAELRNKYDSAVDPSIYRAEFGEGSEKGLESIVYYQRRDGQFFQSKEAAEAEIKARGLVDAEVVEVPRNAPVVSPQIAWHGSTSKFTKFSLRFLGTGEGTNMEGAGFYFTKSRNLAEEGYARTQAVFFNEKEGYLYKVDIPENNELLDYNKFLSDQEENVQKAILKLANGGKIPGLVKGRTYDITNIDQIARTGEDLVKMMSEMLGDVDASKVLRSAGIKGHRFDQADADVLSRLTSDMAGKTTDNFTIYDPKDIKILKRETVPVGEDPLDIAAAKGWEVIDEDPDVTEARTSLIQARIDGEMMPEHVEDMFKPGEILAFGKSIPTNVRNIVKGWYKLLGMNAETVVIDLKDFDDLMSKSLFLKIPDEEVWALKKQVTAAKGVHMWYEGRHYIVINPQRHKDKGSYMATLAHEIGHGFDKEWLLHGSQAYRAALEDDFKKWLRGRGEVDYEYTLLDETFIHQLLSPFTAQQLKRQGATTLAELPDSYVQWATKFSEYWAEQFSRYMLTEERPLGVVEQFFFDLVQKLKEFYNKVVADIGIGEYAIKARPMIRKMLDEHIEAVQKGRVFSMYLKPDPSVLRNGKLSAQSSIRVPGKPNVRQPGKLVPHVPPSSPTGGYLIRQKRFDPLSYDNVGKFSDEDIASMTKIAIDPEHGASRLSVEERVVGVHAEAKMKNDFVKYMRNYFDKLSSNSKARVAALLKEGDSYSDVTGSVGKEFTARELLERGYSDAEIAAYFSARTTRMFVWQLRNGELVRHLGAQGYREFNFSRVVNGVGVRERVAGKKVEDADLGSLIGKSVWDAREGRARRVTQEVIDELRTQGGHAAQLRDPISEGKKRYRYVLGNADHSKFSDLTSVLPYRPGEYSRIYTDEYFVKAVRRGEIDGAEDTVTDVLRSARSEREAKEYVGSLWSAIRLMRSVRDGKLVLRNIDQTLEKLIGQHTDINDFKKSFSDGEFDDIERLDWDYTRTKEEYLNNVMGEAAGSGRAFYGKRGGRIYSVDRQRDNALDPFAALQAEVTNISRVMSLNQWRETNIRRWMNTFGHLIGDRTGDDVADFFKLEGVKFTKNSQETLFAERAHRYILRQIGVKTKEQQMYEAAFRRISEDIEGRTTKRKPALESIGARLRQSRFLDFIRSTNFHLTLGMFNPAQLLVQANGAVTAMAIHPLYGAAAAKTFPLLRMALMSDNPDVWRKMAKLQKLSDLGLSNADEFEKLVKAIRRSGILNNTRSTSLYNLEDGKLDMFANLTTGLRQKSTFFFDRGEEFTRVVAFDVARREWIKKNPEGDWTSNLALKQIMVRQDDLTQNMTRANLAAWQSGALSVPFQFLQYNIKLFANVVSAYIKPGRGFTRTEATKLLAAHLALYGAAGNGLNGLVEEMMPQETKDSLSVEQKTYIGQGMIAGLIYSLTEYFGGEGASIAVGSRLGTFDYYQQLAEHLYKDPANVYEVLLGPTYSQVERLGVIKEQAMLWHKDPDVTSSDIIEGLKDITFEQVSSLRNATKAYLYYTNQGRMVDKNNEVLGQLNNTEMLAQALGFSPTVAVDTYNMYKSKKAHSDTMDDLAKLIMKTQKDIMIELNKGTPEGRKRAMEKSKTLQALWPDNAGDMADVQRRIREDLFPYDSQLQKLLADHLWSGMNFDKPLVVTEEPRTPIQGYDAKE